MKDSYLVYVVVKGHPGSMSPQAWDGRKFSGLHNAKLFGMEKDAQVIADKRGGRVELFTITAASQVATAAA